MVKKENAALRMGRGKTPSRTQEFPYCLVTAGFGVYVMKDRGLAASQADESLWFSSDGLWGRNNWRRRLPSPHATYGSVRIWGEVMEHATGYRAQYARVMSLEGLYPANHQLLAALRAKYGIEHSRLPS
jgi:hypothetical protein